MFARVAEFITRYSMFHHGARAGVAVSGGADSVCLLHVLLDLAPRWDLRLTVLHLNHKLRGAESEADENFVRDMAARLGLPVEVRAWERDEDAGNLEASARDARLRFFSDLMANGTLDRVALGHTRSDQAETVLFRLLRGAGTAGLSGIRPVTDTGIVRPLLGVERAEVEAFLREREISWREDSTNASRQFARNRIRHDLLPLLAREWNPAISDTLANTADWALAEETYWDGEVGRLEAEHLKGAEGGAVILRADALSALPLAAARRLVRRAAERVKGNLRGLDFRHVDAVVAMAAGNEGHGRLQAAGLDIFRSFEWLRIGKPGEQTLANRNYRLPAPVPGTVPLPGRGRVIHLELLEKSSNSELWKSVYNGEMGCINWGRVSGPLEMRNWRPGDQYQPAGSPGEEKIKSLFQEARIPLWERRHWPVLTEGPVIVWARRFGPAAQYAADPASQKVLAVWESGELS